MKTAKIKCLYTEIWPIEKLVENPKNPNRHPEDQLRVLGHLIVAHGWRNPIVVSRRSGMVVKGHGRLAAARRAGLQEVPVELQEYSSEAEELADMIADNRIAELSERDELKVLDVLNTISTDGLPSLDAGYTEAEFVSSETGLRVLRSSNTTSSSGTRISSRNGLLSSAG